MILFENEHYYVQAIPDALDEDGGRCEGYGVFNKTTGVREATGLVLPEVKWRATQFYNMHLEMEARENEPLQELAEGVDEDVTLQ